MTRDDSSGGWLAQDGGALSRVGVCRLLPSELAPVSASGGSQFLIRGERLRDKQVKPASLWGLTDPTSRADLWGPAGNPGLSAAEGLGLHHSHAHISSLEGGGQEVWLILPESSRRQSF